MAISIVEARAPNEFASALLAAVKERVGALLIIGGMALFYSHRARIAELAIERRLPTMTGLRDFVEVGCLMAYGPNLIDGFRRAAWYVDRILKGAKPRRSAGRTSEDVRPNDQSENGEGARA